MKNIEVGSLVISKAGRDCGELYMVWAVKKNILELVNGDTKKMENPKRKNSKHVIATDKVLKGIAEKIKADKKIFDSEIYSAVKNSAENLDKNI